VVVVVVGVVVVMVVVIRETVRITKNKDKFSAEAFQTK
jgi:hypothetical protein